METDAEAGDAGCSPSEMSEARDAPKPAGNNLNATSYGTAMRPLAGNDKEEKSVFIAYVMAIIGLALGIGVVIALTLAE